MHRDVNARRGFEKEEDSCIVKACESSSSHRETLVTACVHVQATSLTRKKRNSKEFPEAPALRGIKMKLNIQKEADILAKETDTTKKGHSRIAFYLCFKTGPLAKRFKLYASV